MANVLFFGGFRFFFCLFVLMTCTICHEALLDRTVKGFGCIWSLKQLSYTNQNSAILSSLCSDRPGKQRYDFSAYLAYRQVSREVVITVCIYICFVFLLLSLFFYTSEVWPVIINNLSHQSTSPPRWISLFFYVNDFTFFCWLHQRITAETFTLWVLSQVTWLQNNDGHTDVTDTDASATWHACKWLRGR